MLQSSTQQVRPWSPVAVAVIALVLPAGGAVLTVRNLHRLSQIDAAHMRRQTILLVGVFAIGLAGILSVANVTSAGQPQVDGSTTTVLGVGVALASYFVQLGPFRAWRTSHRDPTSSWTSGILTALLYQLLSVIAAALLFGAVSGIRYAVSGQTP